jgi:hypothetical protein
LGEVIFWLLAVLAIVTVVGHGIWVLAAAVLRALGALPPSADARPSLSDCCPRCFSALDHARSGAAGCDICGWPGGVAIGGNLHGALNAIRAHLVRLARLGVINSTTRDRLIAAVHVEAQADRPAAAKLAAASVELPQSAVPAHQAEVVEDVSLVPLPQPTVVNPSVSPPVATPPSQKKASPATPAERVRKYSASRDAAAAEPPLAPPAPPPPRREALSRLFAAFLEEKNIRWGELVGGLLIVGSSVALVISFWAEIASRPFF